MVAFALKLVLAHILGDFVFQPDKMARHKREQRHRSSYLYWHLFIHTLLLLLLLQFDFTYWIGAAAVLITHFFIDVFKGVLEEKLSSGIAFVVDQVAHLFIIFCVVIFYFPFAFQLEWFYSPKLLLFLLALVLVSFVSAIIMKMVMGTWNVVEDKDGDSLPRAGKYIGMLERLFVFAFIVLQQWEAIGLLIAAKSIFRFSDLSRAKDRKLTEYVLIGTLLSFGLAFIVGLGYLYFLRISLF